MPAVQRCKRRSLEQASVMQIGGIVLGEHQTIGMRQRVRALFPREILKSPRAWAEARSSVPS